MKIVVAFNSLSPKSHSLKEAEGWARERGAELILTHVSGNEFETLYWDTEGIGNVAIDQSQMYEIERAAYEEMQVLLEKEVQRLKKDGILVTGIMTKGDPASEIIVQAQEVDADLIIVGCHKREGYQGMIYKSIIEKSDRPVLVVPTIDPD